MNRTKRNFVIILVFWSIIALAAPFYIKTLVDTLSPGAGSALLSGNYARFDYEPGNVNASCRFSMSDEKVIILRMDDVQGWVWSKIAINMTTTALSRNIPVTLGVIPKNIDKDPVMMDYLLSKAKNPRVEIAQHGTNHEKYEYGNLSESAAYDLALEGQKKIVETFGVYPVTFIPPNNEYNENASRALSRLGFRVLSAKRDEYKSDGNMLHLGYNTMTKIPESNELAPVADVIAECRVSLSLRNVCVVNLHPQDYVGEDKVTLDPSKYLQYTRLLNGLERLDAGFATFRGLAACQA